MPHTSSHRRVRLRAFSCYLEGRLGVVCPWRRGLREGRSLVSLGSIPESHDGDSLQGLKIPRIKD